MSKLAGNLNYSNPTPWRIRETPDHLYISPLPIYLMPLSLLVIITVCLAIGYITLKFLGEERIILLLIAPIYLLFFAVCAIVAYTKRRNGHVGNWLELNKSTGLISLPRHSLTIPKSHLKNIEVLAGINPHATADPCNIAELHLLFENPATGNLDQLPLLGSPTPAPLTPLALRLRQLTELAPPPHHSPS